jgi:hypothetical protein
VGDISTLHAMLERWVKLSTGTYQFSGVAFSAPPVEAETSPLSSFDAASSSSPFP